MIITYDIHELVPYINWAYFFFAWQVKDQDEKARLRQEAETFLSQQEGNYHAYGLFELYEAYGDGDDIVVYKGEKERSREGVRSQESVGYLACASSRENLLIFVFPTLSFPLTRLPVTFPL